MQYKRDIEILRHIVKYCKDIDETVKRFGASFEIFLNDTVYKNAIALCVLQIGELTGKLTQEFKEVYTEMPWNQIKAMRNIVAHNYGSIDSEILWETIENDIPKLRDYCNEIIRNK